MKDEQNLSSAEKVEAEAHSSADTTARKARKRTIRNFPASSFEEALAFAVSLYEFGSGQPARRLTLFNHLGKAPESGTSRQTITNAARYGLINGSYASEFLELTDEGNKVVSEVSAPREKARIQAKLAIENIDPFAGLYRKFLGNKLPPKAALLDAAKEFNVTDDALRFVGIHRELMTAAAR
jgi:hypothetical protein